MARSKKSREMEWPGTTRGLRTLPPTWANDGLEEPLPQSGRDKTGLPVRELLLAQQMQLALEGRVKVDLKWVLKQVTDHEIARIRFGPGGYGMQDIEMSSPETADDALRLLGLTMPGEYEEALLRRWMVDKALARHPGRTREHMGLGRVIEGAWDGPMPRKIKMEHYHEDPVE